MMRAYFREIAAGLMTVAMALPLATAPTYTLSDNAAVAGLTVAGSPGTNAGMMVAIPVSGTDEQANKPHRRAPVRQKHTGS